METMEQKNLGILEAIGARRSTRAYRPEAVAEEVLRSVMEAARRAPSGKNSQPWEAYVVFGNAMTKLRGELLEALKEGHLSAMASQTEPKSYSARRRDLFELMGPAMEASGWKSNAIVEHSIALFDAPAGIFLCIAKDAGPRRLLDLGIYVQTLCLSAEAFGLGTCVIGYARLVEKALRRALELPQDQEFVLALSMGYPDEASPMNSFTSPRVPLEENVRFIG